jgi:PBP1b-binding outer membrane lipoprotein LpoB
MKYIGIILTAFLLVGCSIPKNPKLSFGKKCAVQGDQVVWSHVWLYDKTTGLDANKDNCKLLND